MLCFLSAVGLLCSDVVVGDGESSSNMTNQTLK